MLDRLSAIYKEAERHSNLRPSDDLMQYMRELGGEVNRLFDLREKVSNNLGNVVERILGDVRANDPEQMVAYIGEFEKYLHHWRRVNAESLELFSYVYYHRMRLDYGDIRGRPIRPFGNSDLPSEA